MTYSLGSLFDGSGGFPLAGTLCGVEPRWASEVEPYPIAVTRSRFPKMKHLGDISKINGAEIEPVDIITFGSPCQDLSMAGKRAGISEGTRSGLFIEAVRIIKEMSEATNGKYPTFALWENVPGAFSSNKGEDFRTVLEELIKIVEPQAVVPEVPQKGWNYADSYRGNGWSLAYRVLDSQHWGVPHRRRRIHLVLDLRGGRARQVLFEREGLRGNFKTSRTPWQSTTAEIQKSLRAESSTVVIDSIGGQAEYAKESMVNPTLRAANIGAIAYDVRRASEANVSPTLDTVDPCPNKNQGGIAIVHSIGLNNSQVCPTLIAGMSSAVGTTQDNLIVTDYSDVENYIVRRLTPTECARLQGFPDKWGHPKTKTELTEEAFRFWTEVRNTHAAINGKVVRDYTEAQMLAWYNKLHSDSAEYKMWGNGIALPTALYCMQGLAEALAETA